MMKLYLFMNPLQMKLLKVDKFGHIKIPSRDRLLPHSLLLRNGNSLLLFRTLMTLLFRWFYWHLE